MYMRKNKFNNHLNHHCWLCNTQARVPPSCANGDKYQSPNHHDWELRHSCTQMGANRSYDHCHLARIPQEQRAALCFWMFCVMYACCVGGVLWVLRRKYITQEPARVIGSYAHWHVALGKEKPTLLDKTSKLGIKCHKTEMYNHLPSCNL